MILHLKRKGNDCTYMKITMSLHWNVAFRYLQCQQAFLLGISSEIDGQTFLATISPKSAINELKSLSKNQSETTDPQKEGITNENIFVLIGKNQRKIKDNLHLSNIFSLWSKEKDLRSKTQRSKITFEHMIRPFKWFLWMKVA